MPDGDQVRIASILNDKSLALAHARDFLFDVFFLGPVLHELKDVPRTTHRKNANPRNLDPRHEPKTNRVLLDVLKHLVGVLLG